jgi:hypothetical protein
MPKSLPDILNRVGLYHAFTVVTPDQEAGGTGPIFTKLGTNRWASTETDAALTDADIAQVLFDSTQYRMAFPGIRRPDNKASIDAALTQMEAELSWATSRLATATIVAAEVRKHATAS